MEFVQKAVACLKKKKGNQKSGWPLPPCRASEPLHRCTPAAACCCLPVSSSAAGLGTHLGLPAGPRELLPQRVRLTRLLLSAAGKEQFSQMDAFRLWLLLFKILPEHNFLFFFLLPWV